MAKKDIGIARPILTRRCKRCGKFWTACQPKDDRCKDIATTAMHILANALKVDDDTPQDERSE